MRRVSGYSGAVNHSYRAAILRFDADQQPVYESDGLLVIGPMPVGAWWCRPWAISRAWRRVFPMRRWKICGGKKSSRRGLWTCMCITRKPM